MLTIPEHGIGDPRIRWIRSFATFAQDEGFAGDIAECGVNLGDTSYYMNAFFPERTLYLFDTFEGFAVADLEKERALGDVRFLHGGFNDGKGFSWIQDKLSVIRDKLPHFDRCIVKKGYFPETAADVAGTFCFVNLDMDLYQPMLAGLEFFYDKMVSGGVLLLHDYYHAELPGVKRAVDDFQARRAQKLQLFPIGDECSIAILKP